MNRWLLRMARWAHKPPSEKRVIMVLVIIVLCLVMYGIEWLGLWPDWATAEKMRRR